MGKITIMTVQDGKVNLARAVPIIANAHYRHTKKVLFEHSPLHVVVDSALEMIRSLGRIGGTDLVILECDLMSRLHNDAREQAEVYHAVRQMQDLYTFPLLLIFNGFSISRITDVCDNHWVAEEVDGVMHYGELWISDTYASTTFGAELTQGTRQRLLATISGMDVDGDISIWGAFNSRDGKWPIGVHPYLINKEHLSTVAGTFKSPTDIKDESELVHLNDYQELLITSILTHPKLLEELYGDSLPTTSSLTALSSVQRASLNKFMENAKLLELSHLSDNAVIASANQDSFHPYVIWCMVKVMKPNQRMLLQGREYTKTELTLLLNFSALWEERQLHRFNALIKDTGKNWSEL